VNWNHCTFAGRVTRDAELRYTATGKAVCGFGLAVNDRWRKDDPPLFLDVSVWGTRGEKLVDHVKKGRPFIVAGRLSLRTWQGNDGETHTSVSLDCADLEFGVTPREKAPSAEPEDVAEDVIPF